MKPTVVGLRVIIHETYQNGRHLEHSINTSSASPRVDSSRSLQLTGRQLTEAHKRQLSMDRAGRRQCLASETAEEWEAHLNHGVELVEGHVLHWRLRNSERHTSLDVMGDAEETGKK